jgi:D-alanyl-D-alanine carboxypeptidase
MIDKLRPATERARSHWAVPGVSVVVARLGRPLTTWHAGYADVAGRTPVDDETRFEIGSISKSFTAMAIQRLAARGLVDLDAPVTRYVPWFRVRSEFAPITVRSLLNHTSGLVFWMDGLLDATAQVAALRGTVTGTAPSEVFRYSNVGYALLGLVVEEVAGRSLCAEVTEGILVPLGMTGASARIGHRDRGSTATGYRPLHDDRPFLPGDELVPATWSETEVGDGNVVCTAADLGRYLTGWLLEGDGVLDGVRFAEMVGSLAPGGEPSPWPSRYGLGINVETIEGRRFLTHGGGMVGYSSFVMADMAAGVAVGVLTNAPGDCPAAEMIARSAFGPLPVFDRSVIPDAARYVGEYGELFAVRAVAGGGLSLDGAPLYVCGGGRLACGHPDWRTFHHRLVGDRWLTGPHSLGRGEAVGSGGPAHPLEGHYRGHNPWFTSFRIVSRAGALHLIAATGVEAPSDEPELVEQPDGFRIGADPRVPERLVPGPLVAGHPAWVDLAGARYSRRYGPVDS